MLRGLMSLTKRKKSDIKRWVQRRDLEEREAKVAEKEDKALKEEKDSRPLPNNTRKGGSGKIIIGAILIVIAGVVALSLGSSKVNSRNQCRRLLDRVWIH